MGAKRNIGFIVSHVHNIGHRCFRQLGKGFYCCQFHGFIDLLSPNIECTTKYIREAQHIIYLVRIITSAGGHNDIFSCFSRFFITDLRIRIGHGKNNRVLGHTLHHFAIQYTAFAEPDKNISILHSFGQRNIFSGCDEFFFQFIEVSPAFMYQPFTVKHPKVFPLGA